VDLEVRVGDRRAARVEEVHADEVVGPRGIARAGQPDHPHRGTKRVGEGVSRELRGEEDVEPGIDDHHRVEAGLGEEVRDGEGSPDADLRLG
jgi:hypothetical protein